ncbi:hypothetical protein DdX_18327 [Ditylenchus destructor]|uniref:Uncharacterized protein n=1 Tax=Ditylenchus destructor TaxID=166010 RepID=A0AAD4MJZ3_9BILA|nr:hypothetical protein DdX_18327 [Ditylenchus destructor]
MDIFLDVLPAMSFIFASFIFIKITGVFSPSVFLGQLISTLVFLNVAVCSIYYSWRLTRKTNGLWIKICRVQRVSPVTTST